MRTLTLWTLLCLVALGLTKEKTGKGSGSSSLFNNILQQVTNEKLNELKTQQNLMSAHFQPVLDSTAAAAPTPTAALTLLYDAIRDSPIKDMIRDESTLLKTLRYFIAGMVKDPSISDQIVSVWVDKLKKEIEFAIRKCEYSYLYGSLLSEWLDTENKQAHESAPKQATTTPAVGVTKDKALEDLKTLMFTPPPTPFDKNRFLTHLREQVFKVEDNAAHKKLLDSLKQEIKEYFDVSTHEVRVSELQSCIDGLSSEDYVAQDKKTALRQVKENSEVLSEVASLLTNRIRHLHLWNWSAPSVNVSLELNRGLAGQWRAALSEDVITMLMLRYVGVQWASKFKSVFLRLYDAMWKKAGTDNPRTMINEMPHYQSINGFRESSYRSGMLSELPDSMYSQQARNPNEYVQLESNSAMDEKYYDEPREPSPVQQHKDAVYLPPRTTPMTHKFAALSPLRPQTQHPQIDLRQSFLHVLSTEIKLSHTIHPTKPFVVVQSNYEQFTASLLHEPVLAILEFFHVPTKWLEFFGKFLQTPFEGRQRVRGIPDSHVLGSFFGELALFALDFHINQATGINLHRVLNQFWFWGNDEGKMTDAWRIVEEFGATLGLKVDTKKSGSIITYSESKLSEFSVTKSARIRFADPAQLPAGSVRWAYLELASNGRFAIDQGALKSFTEEMMGLLDKASGSTLQYINVYNKYMEFFVRNFGTNALVLGDAHVQQVVDALRQIHQQLFGEQAGNVVEALKSKTKLSQTVSNGTEIVDVWVYWPLERGGLGLVNPFLQIMALHAAYEKTYTDANELEFTPLLLRDRNNYDEHVKLIEERNNRRAAGLGDGHGVREPEKIPTFEDFVEVRESSSSFYYWYLRYIKLLERPAGLEPPAINLGGPTADAYYRIAFDGDEAAKKHLQWVYTYYKPQLLRHFGTIEFINTKLLPMSMIANIRKSKVKHQ